MAANIKNYEEDYRSNIGPYISKNSNYGSYQKEPSDYSLQSESREKQFDQEQEFCKSFVKQCRDPSNFGTLSKKNSHKNQENKRLSKDFTNVLTHIQTKTIVQKFIKNLFRNTYILPKKLKPFPEQDYLPQIQNFSNTLNQNDDHQQWKIFQPGSKILMIWDIASILINLISLWLCPFQAAFKFSGSDFLHITIIVYLLLDILVNLNRSTISKGEIINTRILILQNYFKGNAIYDIISLIIWIENFSLSIDSLEYQIVQMIQILVTIKKVLTNFDQFFESLYTKGVFTNFFDLAYLIISIYFFAHIVACFWFYIGEKSYQYLNCSWLQKINIVNDSLLIQYNYSIYWAITTIVTVGYGDITPQSWIEISFTTIVMLLSSFLYAYSINSIGIILKNLQDSKQQYKKMLLRINSFMEENNVEQELQMRARNFLKFQVFENQNHENLEETNQILQKMPESLRISINKDISVKIIDQFSFLKDIFSPYTLQEISKNLEIVYLTPEEILYLQNENSEPCLYFLTTGKIILYEKQSRKVLATLNNGEKFGEYQFFTGLYPQCSAKSASSSIIYKISREKIYSIIKQNNKDFERFNNIKDQILLNNNYAQCLAFCHFCQSLNHQVIECPYLTYQPNLEQRLKKQNFHEVINLRNQKKLRKNSRLNSVFIQSRVNESVKRYIENNVQSDQSEQLTDQVNKESLYEKKATRDKEQKSIVVLGENDQKMQNTQKRFSLIKGRNSVSAQSSFIMKGHSTQQEQKSQNQVFLNTIAQVQTIQQLASIRSIAEEEEQIKLDQIREFKDYMPSNNLSFVIKKMERNQNKKIQKKLLLQSSKYTFYYSAQIKAIKMKRYKAKQSEEFQL